MPGPRNADRLDADAQESARRLIDLLQVLVEKHPKIVEAVERVALALVVDDMRQRIAERVRRFTPEQVSTVEALTAQIALLRGDEPGPPPEDEVS